MLHSSCMLCIVYLYIAAAHCDVLLYLSENGFYAHVIYLSMLGIVIISLVEWLVCTVYPCTVLLFLCSKSGCCVLCTMHCLHRTHVAFSPSIFLSVRPPEAYRLIPPSPDSTFFLLTSSLSFLIPLQHSFIFFNILSSFEISFSFS
jgi:hypothetical protein